VVADAVWYSPTELGRGAEVKSQQSEWPSATSSPTEGIVCPMAGPSHDELIVEPLRGCPPPIGSSLWTLDEARRRTLAYIKGISQGVLDWQPPGQRHSVATLLYHIAVFEVDWLYIDILGGKDDEDRRIPECPPELAEHLPYPILMEDGSYTPVSGEALAVHLNRLAAIRDAFTDVLKGMSMEDFRRLRTSGDDLVTPEWVIEHLAQHEAEHRGQLWEVRVAAEAALGVTPTAVFTYRPATDQGGSPTQSEP